MNEVIEASCRQTDGWSNAFCLGSSVTLRVVDPRTGKLVPEYVCPYCEVRLVTDRETKGQVCPHARVTRGRRGVWHALCPKAPGWVRKLYWRNEPWWRRVLHRFGVVK